MKSIHRPVLGVILALLILSSCRQQESGTGNIRTVYVAPTTVPCPGELDQACLLVAEEILTNWQARQKEIQGFTYQPGFFYTLIVRASGRGEPQTWALEEIVTQEPARIRAITIGPERVACVSAAVGMCYIYKENADDDWQYFDQDIGGFFFETGFAYELTILERVNPLSPGAPPSWTLMQVRNQESMSITDVQIRTPPEDMEDTTATPTPETTAWKEVQIGSLGMRTILPEFWQPMSNSNGNAQAWSDGTISFVNFSTVPGFDGQAVLAQMVGTGTQASLMPEQVSEVNAGGRRWLIYARHYEAISLSAAVTVENGTVYIVSLYADTHTHETLLQTILENFSLLQP